MRNQPFFRSCMLFAVPLLVFIGHLTAAVASPPRVAVVTAFRAFSLSQYQAMASALNSQNIPFDVVSTQPGQARSDGQVLAVATTLSGVDLNRYGAVVFLGGQGAMDDFFSDAIFDIIEGVEALAQAQEVPVSQFALAWVTQQAGITSPIIGPRTMQQLEDALASLNVTISEDDQARIDELIPPGTFVRDFYSGADFGPTKYRW